VKRCLTTTLAFALVLAPLLACAAPDQDGFIFDGATDETSKASIDAMQAGRSTAENREFLVAMLLIQLEDIRSAYEAMKNEDHLEPAAFGRKVDGLTREQILERAAKSPTKVVESVDE